MKNIHYIIISLFFTTLNILGQSNNDFRTNSDGNWTDFTGGFSDVWERYDVGTSSWQPATYYPGQAGNITNNVTIIENHTLNLGTNLTEYINSVTIGDESGTQTSISTLHIISDVDINTPQFTIAYDGLLVWDGNHDLEITEANASFSINNTNPFPSNTIGVEYGIFVNTTGCNVNKTLTIDGDVYSNCNGGGPGNPKPTPFSIINSSGGNLSVTAGVNNASTCKNSNVQLTAIPGGIDSSEPSPSYNWIVTLPNGDTESVGTDQDTTTTITEVGTHTFQVAFTNDSGIIAYDNVIVVVKDCRSVITNRRITFRVTPNITPTTVTPSASFTEITANIQFQQYRDNNQNGINTNELQFGYQGPDTFPDVQLLVKNVSYDTFSIISAVIQNDAIPTTSITVDTSTSAFGSGFDILITLTGINFAQNRGIKIIFNNNGVNGACNGGSTCAGIIEFYGN